MKSWKQLTERRTEAATAVNRILFKNVIGNDISLGNREFLENPKCKSLTYGEIDFHSFQQILNLSFDLLKAENEREDPCTGNVFVDLGCGTGKAVFCACLSFSNVRRCVGIDIIPALTEKALELREILLSSFSTFSSGHSGSLSEHATSSTAHEVINPASFKSLLISVLQEFNGSMATDMLANKICFKLGHKKFKAMVKANGGKFVKILQQYLDVLSLDPSGKLVALRNPDILITSFDGDATDSLAPSIIVDPNITSAEDRRFFDKRLELSRMLSDPRSRATFDPLAEIEFLTGDMFEFAWWEFADVVYVASLLFTSAMLTRLSECVLRMKCGTIVISLKPLDDDVVGVHCEKAGRCFNETPGECAATTAAVTEESSARKRAVLVHDSFFKMSWQMARIYIYRIEEQIC